MEVIGSGMAGERLAVMGPPIEVMIAPEPSGRGATDRDTEHAARGNKSSASRLTSGA